MRRVPSALLSECKSWLSGKIAIGGLVIEHVFVYHQCRVVSPRKEEAIWILEQASAKELFRELDRARDDVAMTESVDRIDSFLLRDRTKQRVKELEGLESEVSRMVSVLPKERWAVALNGRFIQGLSVNSVAADMGVSTSSVYAYISQASKWLDENFRSIRH